MVIAQMRITIVIVEGQIINVTFNLNFHGKTQSAQFPIKDIEILLDHVYWSLKRLQHVHKWVLDG